MAGPAHSETKATAEDGLTGASLARSRHSHPRPVASLPLRKGVCA